MANQNLIPQIIIICEAGVFQIRQGMVEYVSDVAFGEGDDAPITGCYHDGYFFGGYRNGDIQATGLNDITINTLDVANAASNADGLLELWPYSGQLYAGGEKTIEIWGYPVNPAGFPLNRVGYHVTPGLIAQHTVAGYRPEFGHPPLYVGTDSTVRWLRGYEAIRVSTPDLERLIADVEDKTTLEAMAYRVAGNAFWQISCDDWTWVFNCNNPGWHERTSEGMDRSRFTGDAVYAFKKWLVGDTDSATLMEVTDNVQTEGRDEGLLPITLITPSIKKFPNRVRVARADFDFMVDPTKDVSVGISWSDDGGANYSVPYFRGRAGGASTDPVERLYVLNTGYSKPIGRRWKLESSSPVEFAIFGGDMSAEIRRK